MVGCGPAAAQTTGTTVSKPPPEATRVPPTPKPPSPTPDIQQLILGDQTRFDPILAFDAIQNFYGVNMQLVSIDIKYVRADGTMDLTTYYYHPMVKHILGRALPEPPADASPLGVDGVTLEPWYRAADIKILVGGTESYQHDAQDLALTAVPKCQLGRLWAIALQHGARKDARGQGSRCRYRVQLQNRYTQCQSLL